MEYHVLLQIVKKEWIRYKIYLICRCIKRSLKRLQNKNGQLKHPSKRPEKRENLMKLYSQKGYSSIDEYFHKKYRKQIIVHTIFNAFPIGVRLKNKKSTA